MADSPALIQSGSLSDCSCSNSAHVPPQKQWIHLDNLKRPPKGKILDSGGGGSVGETVSVHMLMNIGTAVY